MNPSATATQSVVPRTAQETANVALVARFHTDGWGTSTNWHSVWREIMAPDLQHYFHGAEQPVDGLEANILFNERIFAGFPDIVPTIERVVAEGDQVVVLARLAGTHTGEFLGAPASGRRLTVPDVTVFTVLNSKIVEYRYMTDLLKVMSTIGAIAGAPAY